MLSKKFPKAFYVILLFSFLLVTTQCSYFFEEKNREVEIEFDDDSSECLASANLVVSSYFDGETQANVSESNIDKTVECYQEAITSFNNNTVSGRSGSKEYTPDIFHEFLNEFYPDIGISLDQVVAYVKIKGFIVGGQTDSFSKEELDAVYDLLPKIGQLLKRLLPHRKIILQQQTLTPTSDDHSRFKEAFVEAQSELGLLVGELDAFNGNRHISIKEVLSFILNEFFKDDVEKKLKIVPLVVAFKNMALDHKGTELNRNSLGFFMQQTLYVYEATAQFNYFVKGDQENSIFKNIGHVASFLTRFSEMVFDSSQLQTVSLEAVSDIILIVEKILSRSIERSKSGKISYSKFDELFLSLENAELVSDSLSGEALSSFVEYLSEKWFDPQNQGESSLTAQKVSYIRGMMDVWVKRQRSINQLIAGSSGGEVSLVDLEPPFSTDQLLKNWIDGLKKISLHQWNKDKKILFSKEMTQFDYNELTVANSLYLLVEVFLKPYNTAKANPNEYTVTESQTQEIYEVLRILGVEMAFMDSRIYDSGNRAFLEANNFSTQNSNNTEMDFFETYEYVANALNSGQLANEIYEEIPDHCHIENQPDVHFKNVTEKDCFKNFLYENYGRFFRNLPVIGNFWNNIDDQKRRSFLESMEYASRSGVLNNKPYDLGEIRVIVSLTHYIQSIFHLFDKGAPYGVISGEELEVAEGHFRSMIAELILEKRPSLIPGYRGVFQKSCKDWISESGDDLQETQRLAKVDKQISQCLARKLFIHLLQGGGVPTGEIKNGDTIQFFKLLFGPLERRAYRNTEANVQNVLVVFSALAKVNRIGHLGKIKSILENDYTKLLSSVTPQEPPECKTIAKLLRSKSSNISDAIETGQIPKELNPNDIFFCYWARNIYCNEIVLKPLYTYFRDNKLNLFSSPSWDKENKEAGAEDTMRQIYATFGMHRLFSTQCAFPLVDGDTFPARKD